MRKSGRAWSSHTNSIMRKVEELFGRCEQETWLSYFYNVRIGIIQSFGSKNILSFIRNIVLIWKRTNARKHGHGPYHFLCLSLSLSLSLSHKHTHTHTHTGRKKFVSCGSSLLLRKQNGQVFISSSISSYIQEVLFFLRTTVLQIWKRRTQEPLKSNIKL